jgi:CDP-diacylglycerol---glycerol-3-phosphate 3-phosphatidyltransferase
MTTADKLTASRLVLAPVFFAVYYYGPGLSPIPYVAILCALFAVIEVSDLFDGLAARRAGTVGDFGKLFDPYADVFARLTYFACFTLDHIMPAWAFVLILYREFSINFLRMLLVQKGVAMGARRGGKLKSATYMVAGALSLIYVGLSRIELLPADAVRALYVAIYAVYSLAALLAVASFIDYFIQFRKISARS